MDEERVLGGGMLCCLRLAHASHGGMAGDPALQQRRGDNSHYVDP